MTATNHSANQGRVPAQGVPAQQMPTTAPAAPVQGAPVPAQQGQVLQAPHGHQAPPSSAPRAVECKPSKLSLASLGQSGAN